LWINYCRAVSFVPKSQSVAERFSLGTKFGKLIDWPPLWLRITLAQRTKR